MARKSKTRKAAPQRGRGGSQVELAPTDPSKGPRELLQEFVDHVAPNEGDGKPGPPESNVDRLVTLHEQGKVDLAACSYAEARASAAKEGWALPEKGGRVLGSARQRLGLATSKPRAPRASRRRGNVEATGQPRGKTTRMPSRGKPGEDGIALSAKQWAWDKLGKALAKGDLEEARIAYYLYTNLP